MTETTGQQESVEAIMHDTFGSVAAWPNGLAARIDAALATVTAERDHFDEMLNQANECDRRTHEELRELDKRLATVTAERDAARAEVAKLQHTTSALLREFDRAIAHRDWINAGSHGMSVPFHGDFAGAIQHPGLMGRIRWWARELRDALATTAPKEEA